ncbi:GspH/FimT family pseudopilin [Psychromonas sp. SP041]|uniref:GspH/FimT family pseudopilin n=1 Tax=Psychromonas sp. SP041 TaxID=1365007 RepID=UPI001F0E1639|nr:GspH/FimT family pseudopilin [Psychromonas sp. SP041]
MLSHRGFTFIELMITLVILGIVIAISTASFQSLITDQALSKTASQVYYTLQLAKTEAIKRNQKIYVQFCQQQSTWKMGMSDFSGCDCFSANSCQLDGVEKVQDLADGDKVLIDENDINFTNYQASYGALRFSVETGSVVLTSRDNKKLSVIQSAMRLRVCAPDEAYLGYKQC